MTENHEDAVIQAAGDAARVGYLPAQLIDLFGEPIHVYTRAQAIADGTLVDITERAHHIYRQYRQFPSVAMTAAAYADTVAWSEATENGKPEFTGQDEVGRLGDVLWMALMGMHGAPDSDRATFRLDRVPPTGRGVRARTVTLQIALGGDDHGQPALTILLPGED